MGSETKGEIHAALVKVMASVGVVAKSRKNAAQGYQFRGIDDVLSACQSPMAEHGVLCIPRVVKEERETVATKSGGTMVSVRLTVDHYFTARDGSWVICTTVGEAMDSGDKATNKAMSAAMKYCLTMALCIPTHEDDRDTETASPELASRPVASSAPPASRPTARPANAAPRGNQAPSARSGTLNFPPYGRAKGTAISGATLDTLQFYKSGAERSLADPGKSNFHAKERALLEAIEAEIAAQTGGTQPHDNDEPPPHSDSDAF